MLTVESFKMVWNQRILFGYITRNNNRGIASDLIKYSTPAHLLFFAWLPIIPGYKINNDNDFFVKHWHNIITIICTGNMLLLLHEHVFHKRKRKADLDSGLINATVGQLIARLALP